MEFVVAFIQDIHDSKETDKMAPVAAKAYDDTLARFHPWLIRKGAHIAFHALPYRQDVSLLHWLGVS